MSLISPKHLIAPFTHRTHLLTMGAIVLLLAVFRLSGGRVDSSEIRSSSTRTLGLSDTRLRVEDSGSTQGTRPSFTKEVLSDYERNANNDERKGKEPDELAEIERAVGIR